MKYFTSIYLLLIPISSWAQQEALFQYFGQQPPGMEPVVFAPDIISRKDTYEFGSVFNTDVTEFYYGVNIGDKSEIWFSKKIDGRWTEPSGLLPKEQFSYNDPFLSNDESKLYFISKRSQDGREETDHHDIWYVERNVNGWSEPVNAGPVINSDKNEYYISFVRNGSLYFSSNVKETRRNDFDIYCSIYNNGIFQSPVALSDAVNTTAYEADVFVDPDEDYIIFCASRREGLGQGDLYISFKNGDGTWSESKNMGSLINTPGHELCPFVTKDGKYFFYTSNEDIYWVDVKILARYRDAAK